jgi:predicted nucleotidyltransferase component of viral defense system
MIPRDYITEWRSMVPWVQDIQVEQDLVICRALVEIFSNPVLANALAFRGGTALYKLYLKPAARYSEDIDLVQMRAEPAGPVMEALRSVLDPWLGAPRWKQTEGRVTFVYRLASEDAPPINMKLKVEINSREHFAVHGFKHIPFSVASRWYESSCEIPTYELDELLGTKLRALYQRKKGRDLFDLATALAQGGVDPVRIVETLTVTVLPARFSNRTCIRRAPTRNSLLTSVHSWQTVTLGTLKRRLRRFRPRLLSVCRVSLGAAVVRNNDE